MLAAMATPASIDRHFARSENNHEPWQRRSWGIDHRHFDRSRDMFSTAFFTSTYGSTRRMFLRTAGFLLAFLAAMPLSEGLDARFLPGYVFAMLAIASGMLRAVSFTAMNARSSTSALWLRPELASWPPGRAESSTGPRWIGGVVNLSGYQR
jgi:hypothetical protein